MLLRSIGRKVNQVPLPYRTVHGAGGGAGGYEFTLADDSLTWVSGVNVAVPVTRIIIPEDVPAGYKIRGQTSANADMSSPIETVSAEIAGGDLTDLQIDDFVFSALTSGAKYIQVWITNASDVQVSNKSNIVTKTLDVDAPTITSANSANNAENSVLAHALTANESVTWTITGGADAAEFEISGSTLRWASNGTKDYETPDDADLNNTYVVEVTATDAATNATPQTITVTVTDMAEGPSAEVQQYLDRATGMDATHDDAFTALIDGLVADGVWSKLDFLYVVATDTEAHAKLNLKSSSYTLTEEGTIGWVADVGYTPMDFGGNTLSLDTGFNPSTAGGQYALDSAHLGAWQSNDIESAAIIGSRIGGVEATVFGRSGGNAFFRLNNTEFTGISVANAVTTGHYIASRTASNALAGYKDGASIVTGSTASSSIPNGNIVCAGINAGGTFTCTTSATYRAFHGGAGLNSTEADAIFDRLTTYFTAIGL